MAIWDCRTRTSAASLACASSRYCTIFCSDRLMESASVVRHEKGNVNGALAGAVHGGRVAPPGRPGGSSALGVVLVVGLAAARLRQPAADHVADGEDRGVQPGLLGAEAAAVGLVDHRGRDEDAGEDGDEGDEGDELGRLERRLGLGAQTADGVVAHGGAVTVGAAVRAGISGGAHGDSWTSNESVSWHRWRYLESSVGGRATGGWVSDRTVGIPKRNGW